MSIFRYTIITLLIFFINSLLYSQQPAIKYSELTQQFKNLTTGKIKAAKIDNINLRRNEATFILSGGIIYQCPPIDNETHAILYIGNGSFNFAPSDEIEQMQLYRFYKKKFLNENLEFLFLLFTDSTFNELKESLTFVDVEMNREYISKVEEALEYIFDKDENYLKENFVYNFLEKPSSFFYSHFNDNDGEPIFYLNDPTETEDIILMRRLNQRFIDEYEIICQYPSPKSLNNFRSGAINISQYNIECRIEDNLDFSAEASINFTPSFNNQGVLHLYLYSELEIDSILSEGEKHIEYYKEEESHTLWIIPEEVIKKENNYSLKIFYHGDLLERNEFGWIGIKSSINWYPNSFDRTKSLFDLTFHVPAKFKFCSIGEKLFEEENDEVITTRWLSKYPIRNASFNIGSYKEYTLEEKDLPPVKVLFSEFGHNQIAHSLATQGILSKSDMEEKLAVDVVNSFNLFKHVYGEVPLKEIYVTESPYSHGEAFPGLVHLSWSAFQGIHEEGFVELFIAHEVAHQWWGIQVDFQSYHDQWLSEAIAHYSGLWYMQLVKKNKIFFETLDNWKESILNNRKYLFETGQEAGPVWLGYRTSSSETEGDYNLIVYKKGAWIIHMLRNMLLDLQTMKEDKFENMMKDFFTSFSGKYASTQDFNQIISKHFGKDMGWFFKQWIYGTQIPEYKFSYKITKTPDGKFKTMCRVKQENVPANFQMPVNILIKFEDDQIARLRIGIKGSAEFELPLLPLEPKEIIFNDLNSVLCRVDYEEW